MIAIEIMCAYAYALPNAGIKCPSSIKKKLSLMLYTVSMHILCIIFGTATESTIT